MLLVAATERELVGNHGFVCGVGPVDAAAATARFLATFDERDGLSVVHVGLAGARDLESPALVLGSESLYADVIDPGSAFPRVEWVRPDAALLAHARGALPEAHVLPIATSGRIGGGTGCPVEAMEGFGVLRACALAGVPAVELRAVSNAVGEADRMLWRVDDALAALGDAIARLAAVLG